MSAPDEAMRIALGRVGGHEYTAVARDVVDALDAAGWLHDPAEVAALRARVAELEVAGKGMSISLDATRGRLAELDALGGGA